MTLAAAIADIQSKALTMAGIKSAPVSPPESANAFPFVVSYARSGEFVPGAGWANYHHTIYTEIHLARQLLSAAIESALPYAESFAALLLADPQLSGTVQEVKTVRYEFGRLNWSGIDTIGFRFQIDIKTAI